MAEKVDAAISSYRAICAQFSFFWHKKKMSALLALLLLVLEKFSRFLSHLLPFKALIVATNERFIFTLNENVTLGNGEIAGILVGIAVLFFILHRLLYGAALAICQNISCHVCESSTANGTSLERVEGDLIAYLRHFSSLTLFIVLLIAVLTIAPIVALLLIIAATTMLVSAEAATKNYVGSEFFNKISKRFEKLIFLSQVILIAIIFLLTRDGGSFSALKAVFVFVASRQALSYFYDAYLIYARRRNLSWPSYIYNAGIQISALQKEYKANSVYFTPEEGKKWLATVVNSVGIANDPDRISAKWRDVKLRYVHSFIIESQGRDEKLILNIFRRKHSTYFEVERKFLSQNGGALGAIYLGSYRDKDFLVNICKVDECQEVDASTYKESIVNVLTNIWCMETPGESYSPTVQKFGTMLDRLTLLRAIADSEAEIETIAFFENHYHAVCEFLRDIPHALDAPELSSKTVLRIENNAIVNLNWSRVCVEPIGSFLWRLHKKIRLDTNLLAKRIAERDARFNCVTKYHLEVSSGIYGYVKSIENGFYSEALSCLMLTRRSYSAFLIRESTSVFSNEEPMVKAHT